MTLVPRVGELGEVLADGGVEGVVVGDVGREAADLLALAGEGDDLGELLGGCVIQLVTDTPDLQVRGQRLTRLKVVIPTQPVSCVLASKTPAAHHQPRKGRNSPPAVRRIDIEMDVVELQLGDSKRDPLLVHRRRLRAELNVAVGDHVGQ